MSKEQTLKELTETQYEILSRLGSDEYCRSYAGLSDIGDKKSLQPEIKKLMKIGLVELHRGLMNDDGEVAGSGFCRSYRKSKEIELLIEKYESKNPNYLAEFWMPDKTQKVKANKKIQELLLLERQRAYQTVREKVKKHHKEWFKTHGELMYTPYSQAIEFVLNLLKSLEEERN